jgi:hypothetical protein
MLSHASGNLREIEGLVRFRRGRGTALLGAPAFARASARQVWRSIGSLTE